MKPFQRNVVDTESKVTEVFYCWGEKGPNIAWQITVCQGHYYQSTQSLVSKLVTLSVTKFESAELFIGKLEMAELLVGKKGIAVIG